MVTVETLTVDVVHTILHDQIKELAQTFAARTNIKLESVSIDWFDQIGGTPQVFNVKLFTSKR